MKRKYKIFTSVDVNVLNMVHINIYNHIRHLMYEKVLVPCSSIKIDVDDASNLYISNMVRTFISSINGKQKRKQVKES